MTTNTALTTGDRVIIEKGCAARGVAKGTTAQIINVIELGADYTHSVAVRFQMLNGMKSGKVFTFYARHINRLADGFVNLNDGNPLHKIVIRRR